MNIKINQLAVKASVKPEKREELIRSQTQMILRTASSACHHYVTQSDDEWSVALNAFSRAIDAYSEEEGDFLPFAQMLIKRDLIDYYRSQKKYDHEVLVPSHVLEGNGDPEEDTENIYLAVVNSSHETADTRLRDEILAINELLSRYGFRFYDLTECSPQQDKTRMECRQAIRTVLADQALYSLLEKKRKLPIRALSNASGVSRKTLDRYRKYIIMAALVLCGDYPYLAEYLRFVREV